MDARRILLRLHVARFPRVFEVKTFRAVIPASRQTSHPGVITLTFTA